MLDCQNCPDTMVTGKHGNTMLSFARNCLLARRLVEHGVRFINILYGSWDHHDERSLSPFKIVYCAEIVGIML